ncbi:hypothetical protein HDU81_001548 [Chytriomyces hyalinus]|nr:hypothetical protein HDU81_001548 [Chytriomyces hyalinus]
MTLSDDAGFYVLLGIFLGIPVIIVLAQIRLELEDQRRFQRQYLTLHGKLDSLMAKMDAEKERSGRLKDALLVAISDGKPPGDLRALLGDIYATYAQLAALKNDCRIYEGRMHAVSENMSSSSYDKVQSKRID